MILVLDIFFYQNQDIKEEPLQKKANFPYNS